MANGETEPMNSTRQMLNPANRKKTPMGVCFRRLVRAPWFQRLRVDAGSQLVELALVLPFLVVMVVGIVDFGSAYNQKHILTNAARDAARITVSSPTSNATPNCVSASTPCSIQAAADAAKQYLLDAGLNSASCLNSGSATSSGTLTWTFSCNNVTLTINRGLVVTGGPSGSVIQSTQVTLSYPHTWIFGNVIKLLVPGASPVLPSTMQSTVVMQNLT